MAERVRSLVGTRSGGAALIPEASRSTLAIAVAPLLAGDPTDAVADAQLRHRPVTALEVLNELMSFEHRVGLQPGHPSPKRSGEVLAMCPDTCKLCTGVVPGSCPTMA